MGNPQSQGRDILLWAEVSKGEDAAWRVYRVIKRECELMKHAEGRAREGLMEGKGAGGESRERGLRGERVGSEGESEGENDAKPGDLGRESDEMASEAQSFGESSG